MSTMMLEVDVPKRARWMAQDTDGRWYFYECMPKTNMGINWINQTKYSHKEMEDACMGVPPEDYTKTLYRVYP